MSMTAFEVFGVLKLDRTDYDKDLKSAEKSASSVFSSGVAKAAKIGLGAVTAATTAVVGFGATAVKTGSQFDSAMGGVAATLGKSVDDLNDLEKSGGSVDTTFGHFEGTLRDFAKFMGQNTAFSATQAAEALNYMALAGYNTQESMEMLPTVLDMAAAGGMDLAKASDMITDTQKALGQDFGRTKDMVNEFAKAASTGNTSVEQLGEAMLRVGGLGQELNGGFVTLEDGTKVATDGTQELEIAFTAMANAGVKGAEAGTHMRNMLLKLSDPTDAGTKALEDMGVAIFDTEGNMRSLSDIFGDLNTQLGTMTQQDRIQVISDLFNTRDLASAEALLNAMNSDWDAIGASILDAGNAASEMAETRLDNLTGDITLFKSALESAQIEINDQLSPTLREFVQFSTQGISDLTTAFQEGGLEGAMGSFGSTLADGLQMVVKALPEAVKAGAQLLGAFITGIVDSLPEIGKAALEIVTMFYDGIIQSGPEIFNVAMQLIKTLWDGIVTALPILTSKAVELMKALAQGIRENLPVMIEEGLHALMEFSGSLRESAGELISAGIDMILALVQGLVDGLPAMIETIPTIISNIAGIINDNMPKILVMGVKIIVILAKGLIQAIPVLIKELPKIIKAIIDVFMAINWMNLGKSIITAIGNGVKSLASTLPEMLKKIGSDAFKAFKDLDWLGAGKYALRVLINGIKALARSVPPVLKTIGKNAVNAFKSIDWISLGKNIVLGIISGIGSLASKLYDKVSGLAKDALSSAAKALGIESPSKKFMWIGEMVDEGFAKGITDNIYSVKDAMDSVVTDISDVSVGSPSIEPSSGGASILAQMDGISSNLGGRDLTVILELDKMQFAKAVYQLNNDEVQRVGLQLAGGVA